MSEITPDIVAHMADLSRIDLSPAELERFVHELGVIAEAVAKVNEVASADVVATSHPIPLTNVMREDVVGPTLTAEEALASSPRREGDYFTVPTILGKE